MTDYYYYYKDLFAFVQSTNRFNVCFLMPIIVVSREASAKVKGVLLLH